MSDLHDDVNESSIMRTTVDEQVEGHPVSSDASSPSPTSCERLATTGIVTTDGWLFLRSRFSKKWKKRWFVLKGIDLRYGTSETKKPKGRISLDGARIREADKDAKRHAFSVEPRSGHRIYYLQALDDVSRMKWMQSMCFAKFSHRSDDDDDDRLVRSPCTIS